ncbi:MULTISPECIES: LacI family DNA-binding transcriptional regulator [unclassified Microbacterium]|uniref:LacI family DNA-binding transcriptional regulator n=1 Tax=Microbacterium TaxID=33882 RepID=UPI003B9EFD46
MSAADRPPTQVDVAREAGVSRALVSIAYRGVKGITPETRQRIFDVGDAMGYRPNVVAARLASKYSSTIGVFLLDLYNEIFADIYEGIRSVITAESQHVVLTIGSSTGERDGEGLRNLQLARADVVIAAGLMMPDDEIAAHNAITPIVSTARQVPGVHSVYSDDLEGGRQAVAHLWGLGHRRIAHIASPRRQGYEGRRIGYESAMAAHGLPPLVVEADYNQRAAAAAARELLDLADPPTAIFANNDVAALGVLDVLFERDLVPGRDLSVVGYDNTPVAQLPAISLTSIDLHAKALGVAAANVALRRIESADLPEQNQSSPPELVVRRSTQPPRLR